MILGSFLLNLPEILSFFFKIESLIGAKKPCQSHGHRFPISRFLRESFALESLGYLLHCYW